MKSQGNCGTGHDREQHEPRSASAHVVVGGAVPWHVPPREPKDKRDPKPTVRELLNRNRPEQGEDA